MDKAGASKTYILGDRSSSDIVVRLRNREKRPEWFYCHSSILIEKSKYFADRLALELTNCIEVYCSEYDYDYHVKLLKLLYVCTDLLIDSWDSIRTALGVLQAAVSLHCEEITQSCIQYLEAVPWEDKEEEEILKAVSGLGSLAMPILARIQPVDLNATKNVFLSAIRIATSRTGAYPPFADELKTSAQEQIEYMLGEDEDTPLITADEEVKSEVRMGLSNMLSVFTNELSSLLLDSNISSEAAENEVLQSLLNLDWMCNILPKMDLLRDFVFSWVENSNHVLAIVQDKKFDSIIWGVKMKLIEVTGKVLEAVGYGNVILPAPIRVQLLKIWLPFIRKMKPLLDSKGTEEINFPFKMDDDLCQSIEGAIISLVLALPSNDQADILSEWMQTEELRYPDLSEAFEVWCYRTKSAKRRLVVGFDSAGNATVSL
ncbi:hypothetical protein AQUCO_01300045v1 [Aquilegia coerulea]|uniref:Uncharacterized protein n=1 Tax=Aquilegia coerulea TaxID=218851 RepID=A0A2G5DZC5_AQUCA|nr:hypothetical protein AQUCO_01300045v1 [Aquilegia coerulea]